MKLLLSCIDTTLLISSQSRNYFLSLNNNTICTSTFSNHLMGLDPIRNQIPYVVSYLSMYSFLADTSITLDLFPLSMDVFSQDHHVSQSLLSPIDMFYSTVEIICHTFCVCWVNFLHVVTIHLTHSSDVSFSHVFPPHKLILNTQHQPYVFITNGCGDDRRLSCEAFVSKPSTLAQTFGPHQQIQLVGHISR